MSITLVSRAAFAKQHRVSKPAVQKWEKRGLLVIVDGKVSAEASDRNLLHAGMGKFSDRTTRATTSAPPAADAGWNGEVRTLPYEARLLVAFVSRIAAHGGLAAWECGADLDTAKKVDGLFRILMMDAAAELLTDMQTVPPAGTTWADVPMWDDDHQAKIDWSAVETAGREAASAQG